MEKCHLQAVVSEVVKNFNGDVKTSFPDLNVKNVYGKMSPASRKRCFACCAAVLLLKLDADGKIHLDPHRRRHGGDVC
jgi:hypothetical protein